MTDQKNGTERNIEEFDIYVQKAPFPCNNVAAHPCGDSISQNEAKAALSGYLLGLSRQYNHTLIKPFFASQSSSWLLRVNLVKEITRRNYSLPKDFDPIIFAVKLDDSFAEWIEWELNFFFNMTKIEKV